MLTLGLIDKFFDPLLGRKIKIITRNGFQMAGRLDAWDYHAILISICGVEHLAPWPVLQLLPPGCCPEFLPWAP